MNPQIRRVLSVLWLLLSAQPAQAFLPGNPIELTLDVVVNPVKGSQRVLCSDVNTIEVIRNQSWWVSVEPALQAAQELLTIGSNSVRCGKGNYRPPVGAVKVHADRILASGSIRTRIARQMQDERVVSVEVVGSLVEGSPPDNEAGEHPPGQKIDRMFSITEKGQVFIPLFIANKAQRETTGVRDIFLRISVAEQKTEADSVYGVIRLVSGPQGAEVFIDGGLAGTIPGSGELTLRNVAVGMHEVGTRDASGHYLGTAVRVEAGRVVLAAPGEKGSANFILEHLGENEHGYPEFRRARDGAVVVKIPEGEFMMGNKDTERAPLEHMVYLSAFAMDKLGVSWGQYKKFAESTRTPLPLHDAYWGDRDDFPAVYVTWEEASNYCQWAGGRLPTEAEREKAARGTDERLFPWGEEQPNPELGVFRISWGYGGPAAVGGRPKGASPYGLLDMGGNVWEWTADWYDGEYYEQSPYRDPKGPALGTAHVVRGGSWDSRPTVLSASCRSWGHLGYRDGDFGFRCAMNVPE